MSGRLLASGIVPAHEGRRIFVGDYETQELVPKLAIDYESKRWVVRDDVQWVEGHSRTEKGSFLLIVFVENYSPHEVTLNVRQAEQ
jgi:hypothetical protein